MTLYRIAYALLILVLVGVVLIAWTAIPDCYRPGVCG